MKTCSAVRLGLAFATWAICAGVGSAKASEFSQYACAKRIDTVDINAIIEEVFIRKIGNLAEAGNLPQEFWLKNKDLVFAVCDNKASYDTRVYYGKGVVFDLQMIIYLFAQSRALILGRYISLDLQFTVYGGLVDQFVRQTPALSDGPIAIVEQIAASLGMDRRKYEETIATAEFKKREQTLFLVALYFLSMHERCHVGLDHEARLAAIAALPESERPLQRQKLEIDADACALDIVNADESQFDKSPISFFGVMMTIATQAIVSHNLQKKDEETHPSTKDRLEVATRRVLSFLAEAGPVAEGRYRRTIEGTSSYFGGLLDAYAVRR